MTTDLEAGDQISALLGNAEMTISDDGFTDQVMSSLPRRRLATARMRRIGLGAAAALGGALALAIGPPLESIAARFVGSQSSIWLLVALFIGLMSLPVIWAMSSE